MSGSQLPLTNKLTALVVKPPDVVVRIVANGRSKALTLRKGEPVALSIGQEDVMIALEDFIERVAEVTTWRWTLRATVGGVREVRDYLCMTENEARKQWNIEFPGSPPRKIQKSPPPSA